MDMDKIRRYWAPLTAGVGAVLTVGSRALDAVDAISLGLSTDWWMVIGLSAFFLAIGVILYRHGHLISQVESVPIANQPIKGIIGQTFIDQTVFMDGCDYVDCVFQDCTFRWNGGRWAMHNPNIRGIRRFETKVEIASHTVDVLKFLGLLGNPEFAADWHHLPEEYFRSTP